MACLGGGGAYIPCWRGEARWQPQVKVEVSGGACNCAQAWPMLDSAKAFAMGLMMWTVMMMKERECGDMASMSQT